MKRNILYFWSVFIIIFVTSLIYLYMDFKSNNSVVSSDSSFVYGDYYDLNVGDVISLYDYTSSRGELEVDSYSLERDDVIFIDDNFDINAMASGIVNVELYYKNGSYETVKFRVNDYMSNVTVTGSNYGGSSNVVSIKKERVELQRLVSNVARQYYFKRQYTDYDKGAMDSESGKNTFMFRSVLTSPEMLNRNYTALFDCSSFVANVYTNALGYNFSNYYNLAKGSFLSNKSILDVSSASSKNSKIVAMNSGKGPSTALYSAIASQALTNMGIRSRNNDTVYPSDSTYKNEKDKLIVPYYYVPDKTNYDIAKSKSAFSKFSERLEPGDVLVIIYDEYNKNTGKHSTFGHTMVYSNLSDKTNDISKGFFYHSQGKVNGDDYYSIRRWSVDYLSNISTKDNSYKGYSYLFSTHEIDKNINRTPKEVFVLRPINEIMSCNNCANYYKDSSNNNILYTSTNSVASLSKLSNVSLEQYITRNSKLNSSINDYVSKYNTVKYDNKNSSNVYVNLKINANLDSSLNDLGLILDGKYGDIKAFIVNSKNNNIIRDVSLSTSYDGKNYTQVNFNNLILKEGTSLLVRCKHELISSKLSNGIYSLKGAKIKIGRSPIYYYYMNNMEFGVQTSRNNNVDNGKYHYDRTIFKYAYSNVNNWYNGVFKLNLNFKINDLINTSNSSTYFMGKNSIFTKGNVNGKEYYVLNTSKPFRNYSDYRRYIVPGLYGGTKVVGNPIISGDIIGKRTNYLALSDLEFGDIILTMNGNTARYYIFLKNYYPAADNYNNNAVKKPTYNENIYYFLASDGVSKKANDYYSWHVIKVLGFNGNISGNYTETGLIYQFYKSSELNSSKEDTKRNLVSSLYYGNGGSDVGLDAWLVLRPVL